MTRKRADSRRPKMVRKVVYLNSDAEIALQNLTARYGAASESETVRRALVELLGRLSRSE